MKNFPLLLFIITVGISVKTVGAEQLSTDTVMTIESGPNGTADIKFSLLADSTFTLSMYLFKQPMDEDDEESYFKSSGEWGISGDQIRLTFLENVPILEAIFDESYTEEYEFEVIDDNTVVLNAKLEAYHIWGVTCDKIEK